MKIHWRQLESGRRGTIAVTPEDADDIWSLYSIIVPGDEVESLTMRRVVQESSTGSSSDSHKVKVWLLIRVEKIDADLKAASLRLNGRNIRESEHVKMGSYHTLDIEPERKLKISKEEWSILELEILEQSASATAKSQVAAVLIQEGSALFCVVNQKGDVRILDRFEQAVPKKKLGTTSKIEGAMDKFYCGVMEKLRERYSDLADIKALVLAGPGDYKDELFKRFIDKAVREEDKKILGAKGKILRISLSNAQPNSLKEILKEPRIASLLADTKEAQESRLLDTLCKGINGETGYSCFGIKSIERAATLGAVKSLLLSDSLFRSTELGERKRYCSLVGTVKQNGGQIHIFSAGSETDQRLTKLTGVAAILLFPLFDYEQ